MKKEIRCKNCGASDYEITNFSYIALLLAIMGFTILTAETGFLLGLLSGQKLSILDNFFIIPTIILLLWTPRLLDKYLPEVKT